MRNWDKGNGIEVRESMKIWEREGERERERKREREGEMREKNNNKTT